MKQWRYGLATAGVLFVLYGGVRLIIAVPGKLPFIALWLVGVVVIHDGVLSPLVVGIGWLLARVVVDPRVRRYVQATLIIGGMITIIALPMIYREGTHTAHKAWLLQNYGANLAVLLGLVVGLNLLAYLFSLARDHRFRLPPAPRPRPRAPLAVEHPENDQ